MIEKKYRCDECEAPCGLVVQTPDGTNEHPKGCMLDVKDVGTWKLIPEKPKPLEPANNPEKSVWGARAAYCMSQLPAKFSEKIKPDYTPPEVFITPLELSEKRNAQLLLQLKEAQAKAERFRGYNKNQAKNYKSLHARNKHLVDVKTRLEAEIECLLSCRNCQEATKKLGDYIEIITFPIPPCQADIDDMRRTHKCILPSKSLHDKIHNPINLEM
jgi:hypothetical protein